MNINTVARAICDANKYDSSGLWDHWVEVCGDQSMRCVVYRKMAEAAIEALGLTEEWGHSIQAQKPCQNKSREEASEALGYWGELFHGVDHHGEIWTRLVSPWVRSE